MSEHERRYAEFCRQGFDLADKYQLLREVFGRSVSTLPLRCGSQRGRIPRHKLPPRRRKPDPWELAQSAARFLQQRGWAAPGLAGALTMTGPGRLAVLNGEVTVPTDLIQAAGFIAGMWIAFELLLPLVGG